MTKYQFVVSGNEQPHILKFTAKLYEHKKKKMVKWNLQKNVLHVVKSNSCNFYSEKTNFNGQE